MHFKSKHAEYLNGLVPLPFLGLSIINFRDINLNILSLSTNSIEPGQTAQALYWWQRLNPFRSSTFRVKSKQDLSTDSALHFSQYWYFNKINIETRGPWWPWGRSPVYRPPDWGQFKPQGFYLNKLGRHPLEDVSCC
jgi:hypothetical protein